MRRSIWSARGTDISAMTSDIIRHERHPVCSRLYCGPFTVKNYCILPVRGRLRGLSIVSPLGQITKVRGSTPIWPQHLHLVRTAGTLVSSIAQQNVDARPYRLMSPPPATRHSHSDWLPRSEAHTSELQSLMPIPYSV